MLTITATRAPAWTHRRCKTEPTGSNSSEGRGFIGQLAQAAMQRGDAVMFLRIVDQISRLARFGPRFVQLAQIAVEMDRVLVIACSQGAPGRNRRSRCGCRAGTGRFRTKDVAAVPARLCLPHPATQCRFPAASSARVPVLRRSVAGFVRPASVFRPARS